MFFDPQTHTLYVQHTRQDQPYLYALDTRTGSVRWRHPGRDMFAVQAGLVYALGQHLQVIALWEEDGQLAWEESGPGWSTVNVLAEGILVSRSVSYADKDPSSLCAYDARTGTLRWEVSLPHTDTNDLAYETTLIVRDGCCISVENEHDLVRRELATGKQEWRFRAEHPFVTGVTGADGLVSAGTADDHVFAWRMDDGTLLWKYHLGFANQLAALPLIAGGRIYAGTERVLVVLRAEDGTYLWHAFPGQGEDPYWPIWRAATQPLFVQQGVMLVLRTTWSGDPYSSGGPNVGYSLIAYAQDGSRGWRVDDPSLKIVGQEAETIHLQRGARSSQIVALQTRSGEQNWSYELVSLQYPSALVEAGTLYVYEYTGATVQAIDLTSTLQRWVTHL